MLVMMTCDAQSAQANSHSERNTRNSCATHSASWSPKTETEKQTETAPFWLSPVTMLSLACRVPLTGGQTARFSANSAGMPTESAYASCRKARERRTQFLFSAHDAGLYRVPGARGWAAARPSGPSATSGLKPMWRRTSTEFLGNPFGPFGALDTVPEACAVWPNGPCGQTVPAGALVAS